jgi:hypothetical protein
MIDKISSQELNIFETLANPISCNEVLFDNLGSLTEFTQDKCSKVRTYQYPMLSWESMFFENHKLTDKENFKIRKGFGDCVNFGGRLTGKSLIGVITDVLISVFHATFRWGAISSCDAVKVRGVMETILNVFDNHPILKEWNCKHKSHPAYLATFDNKCKLESVNNDIASNKERQGKNWFQKHCDKNWEEEASFLNDSITNKRLMAQAELGMIERLTGMANFKKLSPIGRKFFDLKNENIVINLPSYVNETWDKEKDEAAEKEFGGKQSAGYKTQILGQVVDDGNCLVKGSKILLSNYSLKPIEEIKIGDKLLGFSEETIRKFEESEVLDVIDSGVREVYEIESNGKRISLTPEHRVVAYTRGRYDWIDIKTCLERDYSILSLKHYIENNEDYYYGVLLGIIESDGTRIYDKTENAYYSIHITQSLNCEWKSIEWVLQKLGIQYHRHFLEKDGMYRYSIPRKYNPEIELRLSKLLKNKNISFGFLAGFILGDGCYSKSEGIFQIIQSYRINNKKCVLLEEILKRWNVGYNCSVRTEKGIKEYGINRLELFPAIEYSYKIEQFKNSIFRTKLIRLKNSIKFIRKYNSQVYDLTTTTKTFIAEGFLVHNSVYDIERIRECYKRDKSGDPVLIKCFEINKNNFHRFKEILILDRPINTERTWIALDKGEGAAPTEIIVLFENKGIYKYEINITTFKLSPDEDDEVVEFITEQLKANIVGIDVTSGGGKAMFSYLAKKFNKPNEEHIVGVSFNEKIPIDFATDDKGNKIFDKSGNPEYKEEYIVDWSIQRLKHLFYNKKILAHFDMKLDTQFDNVTVMQSGQRTVYGSKTANHLHQAWQVFAIILWNMEFVNIKPVQDKKPGLGAY